MVINFLNRIELVFYKCALWTDQLLNAVGGKGVVIAALMFVFAISLFLIPVRGSAISGFTDYTKNSIHKDIKRSGNKRGD